MRLLDTNVKYFDTNSYGVPKLKNSWGSIIEFLDAALVDGSESIKIISLSTTEEITPDKSYWLTTLRLQEGHNLKENLSVIEITGASDPILNGIHRVQSVSVNTAVIALDKDLVLEKPLDSQEEDLVSLRLPPLGYQKVFSEPEKAVYKVTTKDDKFCYLRVDNSCPKGYDPTWAKIARVSMYEDLRHIDDYKLRLGIKKAPAYSEDYNRTEENVYNTWIGTNDSDASGFNLHRIPNRENRNSIIIGDSSTFYFHRELLTYNGSYGRDELYTFGKYKKYCYKEDPLPFILRSSQSEGVNSYYTVSYNRYSSIQRDSDWDNHTFNTDENKIYEIPKSNRFALWLTTSFRSSRDTRVSFLPYKNELPFNLVNMDLRFFRLNNTVLEGRYRGLKAIMNNLQDYPGHVPLHYSVFKKDESKYYLVMPCREYHDTTLIDSLLISLENWSDL